MAYQVFIQVGRARRARLLGVLGGKIGFLYLPVAPREVTEHLGRLKFGTMKRVVNHLQGESDGTGLRVVDVWHTPPEADNGRTLVTTVGIAACVTVADRADLAARFDPALRDFSVDDDGEWTYLFRVGKVIELAELIPLTDALKVIAGAASS